MAFLTAFMLLFAGWADTKAGQKGNGQQEQHGLQVLSSPDLVKIAETWVEAYNSAHPEAVVSLGLIREDGMEEIIREAGKIALVSQKDLTALNTAETWCMVVGRDVIVPVMNSNNPFREQLLQQGISPAAFASVYTSAGKPAWGTLLGNNESAPVNAYVFESRTCLSYLAGFMGTEPGRITAGKVEGKDEMMQRIRNDRYAVGFCRLSDMAKVEAGEADAGLCLIPVDLNANQKIDNFEDIYACTGDLSRGIWIGKYPRNLYNKIYTVAGDQPSGDPELAFLEWVVTDGQKYLAATGFSELVSSERLSGIERMKRTAAPLVDVPVKNAPALMILLVLGALLAGVIIFYLVIRITGRKSEAVTKKSRPSYISGAGEVSIPEGLFFDKSHTWVFMERDGKVRVGIDDFLQHVTGRITRVELKRPGDRVRKGEALLSLVQEGKKLHILSPVSGIIQSHNRELEMKPGLLNLSPFSDGWVYEIEPANWLKEIGAYVMGEKYREWIRAEFSRLKDFLSSGLKPVDIPGKESVLQDGGAVRDGVMELYGPEAWEEFQSQFINLSR